MMTIRRALSVGLLALVAGGLVPTMAPLAAQEAGLVRRLETIRLAFARGDADALSRQFVREGRVSVTLPQVGYRGLLGPAPLRAILQQLFAECRTVRFEYSQPLTGTGGADVQNAYVKAAWQYRTAAGEERGSDVYLAVRRAPDSGDWHLVELRASQ